MEPDIGMVADHAGSRDQHHQHRDQPHLQGEDDKLDQTRRIMCDENLSLASALRTGASREVTGYLPESALSARRGMKDEVKMPEGPPGKGQGSKALQLIIDKRICRSVHR